MTTQQNPREFWIYPFKPTNMIFTYLTPQKIKQAAPENFDEIHVIEASFYQQSLAREQQLIELVYKMAQVIAENTCYDACGFIPEEESKETLITCFINNDEVGRKCLDEVNAKLKEMGVEYEPKT